MYAILGAMFLILLIHVFCSVAIIWIGRNGTDCNSNKKIVAQEDRKIEKLHITLAIASFLGVVLLVILYIVVHTK